MQIHDCEQGTPEWHALRSGIVTMSELECILSPIKVDCYLFGTKYADVNIFRGRADLLQAYEYNHGEISVLKSGAGKGEIKVYRCDANQALDLHDDTIIFGAGALTYMFKLIGERITGEPVAQVSTWAMQRGHELEPIARELYMMQQDEQASICGFITNKGCGYSPDALIGENGLLEIKTKEPHLQAELIYNGVIPDEHIAQIQGGIWLTDRDWCDFASYCPNMPLFVRRAHADLEYQANIDWRIGRFYAELERRMPIVAKG